MSQMDEFMSLMDERKEMIETLLDMCKDLFAQNQELLKLNQKLMAITKNKNQIGERNCQKSLTKDTTIEATKLSKNMNNIIPMLVRGSRT